MTVEEYVGLRIRERREELGMSSAEFGSQLGEFLGKPWPRQAVSAAELGKRALGVAEIVAIARVLDTSPSRLLTPPYGVTEVVLPGGAVLPGRTFYRNPGIAEGYLAALWDEYAKALGSSEEASKALRRVGDLLATVADWAKPFGDPDAAQGEK